MWRCQRHLQHVQLLQPVQPLQPLRVGIKKREATSLLTSPLLGGGYLLSHFRSTIGVVRLNFSVRNGKRWDPHAMTTLLLFSPYDAFGMRRGCDGLKRPSGERFARKPSSRLHFNRGTRNPRTRPECSVSQRLPSEPPRRETARHCATRKLSGD